MVKRRDHKNPNVSAKLQRSYDQALAALQRGDSVKAEKGLRKIIKAADDSPEPHFSLALALQAQGKLAPAAEHYRQSTELSPQSIEAWLNLGRVRLQLEQVESASKAFQRAIALDPANPAAHEMTTGPEIWEQTAGEVDAVVCGVGSGGTITGLGRYFRSVKPAVEMILADPEGSVLAGLVKNGKMGEFGSWVVEGIGEDFLPPNCDVDLIAGAYTITDQESLVTARELLAKEGILSGSSSGTLVAAALRYCREQTEPKTVVSLLPDSGNKYLSKMYNDYWMTDQGFMERPKHGDLRDLIYRPFDDRAVVAASPDDTLMSAYGRMRMADVSQLPVLKEDRILGIIDESDLLLALHQNQERFDEPVANYMIDRLEMLTPTEPLENLLPILRADRVAIIVDDGHFLGLITKVDFLNHLRRNALVTG